MPRGKIKIFPDVKSTIDYLIHEWRNVCERAIRSRGMFTVALSGGKTPVPFYRELSRAPGLNWDETFVFIVDERFVPYKSERSNFGMMIEKLFGRISIPPTNLHPIPVNGQAETAAREYEKDIRSFFNLKGRLFPVFDLILLGIGEDGHTASLFPGTPSLQDFDHIAVAVPRDKGHETRITLTYPVINRGRRIIFLLTGKKIAPVLKRVYECQDPKLPATHVRASKGSLLFLADSDAASRLKERSDPGE